MEIRWHLPPSLSLKMTKSLSVFTLPEQRSQITFQQSLSPQTQQTRIHPRPPAGSPRAILFSLFFSFVYAGFRGLRAPGRGIWQGARVQKKPYAVGVPQHKASLVCYVVLGLRDANGDAQLSCHFQDQWGWEYTTTILGHSSLFSAGALFSILRHSSGTLENDPWFEPKRRPFFLSQPAVETEFMRRKRGEKTWLLHIIK